MGDDEIELVDVENYKSGSDEDFSHSILIMKIFKRILDIRSHELTEGRDILFQDNKTGKSHVIYKEDQREAYFGSIEISIQLMKCVFDEEAEKNIKELEEEKKKVMKRNLLDQFAFWIKLSQAQKKEFVDKYGSVSKYVFNNNLPFRENYFKEVVFIYDKIFGELNMLAEREDFFKGETLGIG